MKKLVIGASGFLGSHVTRRLVADGQDVRVMLRKTSSTKAQRELGWEPEPVEESIRKAARFFAAQVRDG